MVYQPHRERKRSEGQFAEIKDCLIYNKGCIVTVVHINYCLSAIENTQEHAYIFRFPRHSNKEKTNSMEKV